ncbi:hypothetical protein RUM43_013641 [Polyplax serrata]|uniref:Uncharacterized protein n=1 Tax=Polyplax serrata TaxID=468196 RepID=A0AAN8NJA6_POLSC
MSSFYLDGDDVIFHSRPTEKWGEKAGAVNPRRPPCFVTQTFAFTTGDILRYVTHPVFYCCTLLYLTVSETELPATKLGSKVGFWSGDDTSHITPPTSDAEETDETATHLRYKIRV